MPLENYLAKRLDAIAHSSSGKELAEAEQMLISLGWNFIGNGVFKRVFGKKGINFVVKIGRRSLGGVPVEIEMGNWGKRGVPSLFCGQTDALIWGIQPKVKTLQQIYTTSQLNKRISSLQQHFISVRNDFINLATNPDVICHDLDCHEGNIGMNQFGALVKFD